MAKIGYARVSTDQQDSAMQISALEKAGAEIIFKDVISGKKTKRDGLDKAIASLNSGDTLIIWKLDRLGRRVIHLHTLLQQFSQKGIFLVSLTEGFDLTTSWGKALFGMMAVFAEMEREIISERTKAALANIKASGKKLGRKYTYKDEDLSKASRATRYRRKKK